MSFFLSNPVILAGLGAAVVIAIFVKTRSVKSMDQVYLLRPRDKRGDILTIIQETDLGLLCKQKAGVVHRFIKIGSSWMFNEGGRMVTKFFGVEATAYTAIAVGDELNKIPVSDFLKMLWTEAFYNGIPAMQRKAVETDVIGITLAIEQVNEEELGLRTLTADDINDENDTNMLNKLAGAQDPGGFKNVYNNIIWLVMGALVMYMIQSRGMI